jgi:hypothetical protein
MGRAKKQQKVKADEDCADTPDKVLKRKHVYQRRNKLTGAVGRHRNPSIDISPFLDMTVWKRCVINSMCPR